jgi:hypothetical protein
MTATMDRMSKHARAVVADNPLLLGVAGIGFAVSFQTIVKLAEEHGLPGWPVLYPLGIDVGILALIVEARKAIDAHRSDFVPRALAWVLAAFTIYVNAHGAPAHDWTGRALHVVMPALWIVFLELTRWRKLAKRRDGEAVRIPRARWFLSPWRTPGMRKRMVLRNVTSYPVAVELEEARLFARDLARAHFGRWSWRRNAPSLLRSAISTGRLGDDVTTAATASVKARVTGGWEQAVRDMVKTAVTEGDKLTASVRREKRQIEATAAATEQRQASTPAKRQKPRRASVKWRDKAEREVTANPAISAAELAQACKVSKRSAERYLADWPGPRPLRAVAK